MSKKGKYYKHVIKGKEYWYRHYWDPDTKKMKQVREDPPKIEVTPPTPPVTPVTKAEENTDFLAARVMTEALLKGGIEDVRKKKDDFIL